MFLMEFQSIYPNFKIIYIKTKNVYKYIKNTLSSTIIITERDIFIFTGNLYKCALKLNANIGLKTDYFELLTQKSFKTLHQMLINLFNF